MESGGAVEIKLSGCALREFHLLRFMFFNPGWEYIYIYIFFFF